MAPPSQPTSTSSSSTAGASKSGLTAPLPASGKAAEPRYGLSFDPWNSSSTGHQRAENRLGGSTGWRDSRNVKLQSQFRNGKTGGGRIADTVGAGSKDWDPETKSLIRPEARARARTSVADMLVRPGTMRRSGSDPSSMGPPAGHDGHRQGGWATDEERLAAKRQAEDEAREDEMARPRKIFDGVAVYVNGSTHPIISDHKLKQVLAENGARMSTHLGRRQVTHVIIGRPAGGSGNGAGGGLAGSKLQREIQKVGGVGIKFVGVEWVLESIKAGKRLSEARFSNLKIAPRGQQSVLGIASKHMDSGSPTNPPASTYEEPPPSGQRAGT